MPKTSRFLVAIAMVALSTTLVSAAHAASASIEQVRNGVATAGSTPVPTWVTGNAGGSNSHYLESHSIPYRTVMDGLPTDGTVIELVVGYNPKRSGSYAIDHLTHFQRVLPHVSFGHTQPEAFDPLAGVSGVGAAVTTATIPVPTVNILVDPDGAQPEPAAMQPSTNASALSSSERLMTLFGGTLIDVTYVSEGDVSLATSSSETQVRIRFTAQSAKAVLAWGGHIACRWDWGFNADGTPRSAGGISGSSYHMRLVGWNLGSVGNQDRSMSTDAVYPVPRCGVSNAGPFCAGSVNTHAAPTGMESYEWTLFNNTSGAIIVGSSTGSSVVVNAGAGGSYGIRVTTGASGFTKACETVVNVNLPAASDAGADQTVCATSPQAVLAGIATGGNGTWSGGGGAWNPSATSANATYTPTAAEITAGGVTLTFTVQSGAGQCPPASDQVRINIQRAATANAGVDLTVCASAPQAQLAGSVGGSAAAGTWNGGAGSFSPSRAALNAIYTPTAAEIATGSVTLTLVTNPVAGPCPTASDAVTINIQAVASANAGADQVVCASSPQVQLAGAVGSGATAGTWSGGAGSYSPNASSLTARYTPTAAEIAAGGVTLTLTTNDPAGPCGPVADQMRINVSPAAIVNAGADQSSCSSSPRVDLQGSVGGGATTGIWSGGTGSFTPSATALNASYLPSAAEVAAGSVTLTLTSTGMAAPCPAISDQVTISILPALSVNAGADQIVCPVAPQVQLAGVVGNGATGGTWSGGTGTFTPNATTLNASYLPTAAEIAAGSVTLTLTTNDPAGPCPAVSDAMKITVSAPRVTVPNRTVCEGITPVQMCANASGGVPPYTYLWSTGATTSCISVADTGSYSVTITDSKGCQDVASGAFRHRECTGMIAHTNVTCASFMDGTGEPLLGDVNWGTRDNIITTIAPGVFFYYTKIVAPSASFTVDIVQTKDNPNFPFCEVQQAQVSLYGSDCGTRDDGATTGGGQASLQIQGATVGQVYIISVKYTLKNLIGTYMDETMGCRYDFSTVINGQVVDADPNGLQIGVPRTVTPDPGVGGTGEGDDPTGETIILRGDPSNPDQVPSRPGGGGAGSPGSVDSLTTDPTGTTGTTGTPDPIQRSETSAPTPVTVTSAVVLERPMPNPFSGAMRMAYAVGAEAGDVEIGVYDLAGRRMKTLESGRGIPGIHSVSWDGRDESGARVRKGMYFVHMRIGGQARQVRVTFVN